MKILKTLWIHEKGEKGQISQDEDFIFKNETLNKTGAFAIWFPTKII